MSSQALEGGEMRREEEKEEREGEAARWRGREGEKVRGGETIKPEWERGRGC